MWVLVVFGCFFFFFCIVDVLKADKGPFRSCFAGCSETKYLCLCFLASFHSLYIMNVTLLPIKAKCILGVGVKEVFFLLFSVSLVLGEFWLWRLFWRLHFFQQHKKCIMKASARARRGRRNEIFHQGTLQKWNTIPRSLLVKIHAESQKMVDDEEPGRFPKDAGYYYHHTGLCQSLSSSPAPGVCALVKGQWDTS